MQTYTPHLIRRNIVLAISGLSFCFFAYQLFVIITQSWSIIEEAKIKTLNEAKEAVNIVENRFQNMMKLANSTAQDLSDGTIKYSQIQEKVGNRVLENAKGMHSANIGLTVAFEPYVFYDSALYAPYFRAPNEKLDLIYINDVYDYTRTDQNIYTDWYHFPLKKGACWTEPHFGRAGNALFTGYQLPFYYQGQDSVITNRLKKDKNGKWMAGVVCADYRLDQIWQEVSRLGSGKTSFGFLITPSGKIVSHPRQKYLGENIKDLQLTSEESEMLHNLPKDIEKHPAKLVDNQWVFYQKVPSTGWILGIVYSQDEMLKKFDMSIRQKTISTTVAGVLALIGFLYVLSGAYRTEASSVIIWSFSTSFSVVCALGMVMIWYLSLSYTRKPSYEEAIIYDESNIHSALGNLGVSDNAAKFIPTGFFVQTIEFQGANNLLVNGYIWQKFTAEGVEMPEDEPNIFFPESESAEYNFIQQDSITKMWEFTVVLRQPFNYEAYPFDSEDIWLRVRSKGFDNHIYLVPDLSSYNDTSADTKPGVDSDLILGDWKCMSSYYSYRIVKYNSNFGFNPSNVNLDLLKLIHDQKRSVTERWEPELFFNLSVQRDFMSPFIGEVVPIVVVAFLVFAILMTQSRNPEKMELTGFNSSSVLGYCASLYFVLIVSHVYTREKLASGHIVYIEYFYFVMYFILLWISLMSLLFISDDKRLEIWNRNDGFLMKVLYWPVFFGIMFIVTVIQFY